MSNVLISLTLVQKPNEWHDRPPGEVVVERVEEPDPVAVAAVVVVDVGNVVLQDGVGGGVAKVEGDHLSHLLQVGGLKNIGTVDYCG